MFSVVSFLTWLVVSICLVNASGFRLNSIVRTPKVCTSRLFADQKLSSPYVKEGDDSTKIVTFTENAKAQLLKLKPGQELIVRMGVKKGGCSGMNYVMELVEADSVTDDDIVETLNEIKCVIDAKSLLYLHGLRLDYSNELIGGGFKFSNPNAQRSW